LQNSRANALGLIIPLQLHRTYDAFWLEFIGGMAAVCAGRHVDLLVSAADDAVDEPAGSTPGFRRIARGSRVDGMLLCDVRRTDGRIAYLRKQNLPFVAFGRTAGDHDYAYIDVDGAAGASQAIEHLLRLGHRRIGFLGVDADFGFSHYRLAGYRQALARAGIVAQPAYIRQDLTDLTAVDAARELLTHDDSPTAIFATADFLALAALRAAREAGLAVPRDLSICVFDDSPLVQHADPPVTTVSQPNRRLGEEAATLLLDRIENPAAPLIQRLVIPTLIVRQSTAPSVRDERAVKAV
ncbi:MAG: substrate-binding domain-containing protein, partial [Chloroflexota bacterium]|nr:substrate-binding domain-containing protein [Chloroflexota bacterium]